MAAVDNLTARVTELEAELAAVKAEGKWRPVTERPMVDGQYLIGFDYDRDEVLGDCLMVGIYAGFTNAWFMEDGDGEPIHPTHWLPIPPLPLPAAQEEPTP